MRSAVANEIVELCNSVIRRGNDIVTAIDMAEDGKMKQYTQLEHEIRIQRERLTKVMVELIITTGPLKVEKFSVLRRQKLRMIKKGYRAIYLFFTTTPTFPQIHPVPTSIPYFIEELLRSGLLRMNHSLNLKC